MRARVWCLLCLFSKDWKYIQSLLRSRGAKGVLQRIQNYDGGHSRQDRLDKAAVLLGPCTLQAAASASPATAAFYRWVSIGQGAV